MRRLGDITPLLVDERVGIIEYVKEVRRAAGGPAFFQFYARACNVRSFATQSNSRNAGGASAIREIALAKAIGEAIERYCSAVYSRDELPLTDFENSPCQCVPPNEFALYSQEQYSRAEFPYVPFKTTVPLRWASCHELLTGETWHVPAAMVYLPYFFDEEKGESPIAERISTGLSCHCSVSEAGVSAICEVIERDAFSIAWQSKMAPPHIRLETLSEANKNLVSRFTDTGSSVTMLNLTMDHGIPTILSILSGRNPSQPALVFAAATSLDPEQAAQKSLEELALTAHMASRLTTELAPFSPDQEFTNVKTQDDHVHLYCGYRNAHLADFIFASMQRTDFQELINWSTGDSKQDIKILGEMVHSVNHKVFLADLTTPDVRDLGLTVIRALIPGFHPLFIGHEKRALGGSRLWEVPQQLGQRGITRETGDNRAPHPYP